MNELEFRQLLMQNTYIGQAQSRISRSTLTGRWAESAEVEPAEKDLWKTYCQSDAKEHRKNGYRKELSWDADYKKLMFHVRINNARALEIYGSFKVWRVVNRLTR